MEHELHQLLVTRGAKMGEIDDHQMEIDQQAADALARPRDCSVCDDHVSITLFESCGHLCLCGPCKNIRMWNENVVKRLPLGRRTVSCPVCGRINKESALLHVIYNTD